MMYNLENHRAFCVVMVIECSVASGEMEFGGGCTWRGREEGAERKRGEEWMGVSGRRGAILIAFHE